MVPTLETARLLLRPLTLTHLPLLVRWEADPVLRDLNDDDATPASPADVEATVRGWLRPGRDDILPFGIHVRPDDVCIGWCMIAAMDRSAGECRVGLTIGERSLWGRGLGREVLSALVDHAFGVLAMRRVLGEVHAFNARSIRLLDRFGFRLLRTEPDAIHRGDRSFDEMVFVFDGHGPGHGPGHTNE